MSLIGELEAAIVQRVAAALTLPGQAHPVVDVRPWPERPREFRMAHPQGCALVIYKGSRFDQEQATAGHLVAFEAAFELGLISRTLREPQVPGAQGVKGAGIYELLQACREALMGWRPQLAAGAVRLRSEDFDDHVEGTWGFSLRLGVPMVTVAERPCVPGPWDFAGPNSCCVEAPALSGLDFQLKP